MYEEKSISGVLFSDMSKNCHELRHSQVHLDVNLICLFECYADSLAISSDNYQTHWLQILSYTILTISQPLLGKGPP